MVKRGRIIAVIFIFLVLSSLNVYLYLNNGNFSYTHFNGMFIKDIKQLPQGLDFPFIIFIMEWIVLLLILVIAFVRHLKHEKKENIKINISNIKCMGKSTTSFDVLYNLLKEKKKLGLGAIEKLFGINTEKALEWATILQDAGLVTIEYPTFSEPEVILIGIDNKVGKKEVRSGKQTESRSEGKAESTGKRKSASTSNKKVEAKSERKRKNPKPKTANKKK